MTGNVNIENKIFGPISYTHTHTHTHIPQGKLEKYLTGEKRLSSGSKNNDFPHLGMLRVAHSVFATMLLRVVLKFLLWKEEQGATDGQESYAGLTVTPSPPKHTQCHLRSATDF